MGTVGSLGYGLNAAKEYKAKVLPYIQELVKKHVNNLEECKEYINFDSLDELPESQLLYIIEFFEEEITDGDDVKFSEFLELGRNMFRELNTHASKSKLAKEIIEAGLHYFKKSTSDYEFNLKLISYVVYRVNHGGGK